MNIDSTHSLHKQRIVITKPAEQAKIFAGLLDELGAHTFLFPTIDIEPMTTFTNRPTFSDDTLFIFNSSNAVYHSKSLWPKAMANHTVIAIGPGTGNALEACGIHHYSLPNVFNSEGLLQMPELQASTKQSILIFCGENPKTLLKKSLKKRGLTFQEIVCYRRKKSCISSHEVSSLIAFKPQIIVVSSQESLTHLYELVGEHQHTWLNQIPLLVISSPMQIRSQQLGHNQEIIAAANASNDAVIKCLLTHLHTEGPSHANSDKQTPY